MRLAEPDASAGRDEDVARIAGGEALRVAVDATQPNALAGSRELAASTGLAAAGLFCCAALGFVLAHDRILTTAGDLGLHYQLVDYFQDRFANPPADATYLAWMRIEPNIAHRLAAALARVGLRGFSSLSVVAATSTAVVWLVLFDQARRVSASVMAAALAILLLLYWAKLRAEHGAEIIGNFFYPQIVGAAAFAVCVVAGAALLERSRWRFVAFCAASVMICGAIHTLPAIELAGTFMVLLALDMLRAARRGEPARLANTVGLAVNPLSVGLNPYFLTMVRAAAHNGSIVLGRVSLASLFAAEIALAGLAGWLLLKDLAQDPPPASALGRQSRAARVLAAMALAASLAGIGQVALLQLFGVGSPYAALKYAFSINSLAVLVIPLVVWDLRGRPPAGPASRLGPLLAVAAQTLLMAVLFVRPSSIDLAASTRLLDNATAVRIAHRLPPGEAGAVMVLSDAPPVVSFAGTIASLRAPVDNEAVSILVDGRPITPQALRLVTKAGDPRFDAPACRRGPQVGTLVVVAGACVVAHSPAWNAPPPAHRAPRQRP